MNSLNCVEFVTSNFLLLIRRHFRSTEKLNSFTMSFQLTADGRVQVFVDGCYRPGHPIGGIGIWFNHGHPLNGAFTVMDTTGKNSNDVELMAAQHAIDIFEKQRNDALLIYTDSQHVACYKEKLRARQTPFVQRVDEQHHAGIREADKLARQGAGI